MDDITATLPETLLPPCLRHRPSTPRPWHRPLAGSCSSSTIGGDWLRMICNGCFNARLLVAGGSARGSAAPGRGYSDVWV